jgi:hypothetical protein
MVRGRLFKDIKAAVAAEARAAALKNWFVCICVETYSTILAQVIVVYE